MPFILKTDAFPDAVEGQEVEIAEPAYYGGRAISAGDEAFVWFSGTVQRLAWAAEVLRVDPPVGRRIFVVVRLVAAAGPTALGLTELMPFRDIRNEGALSGLSNKLYRQSHDKICQLTLEEAAFLRGYF